MTTTLLERFSRREENDLRNYFMINLHESTGRAGIELATPGSAVRLASVATALRGPVPIALAQSPGPRL